MSQGHAAITYIYTSLMVHTRLYDDADVDHVNLLTHSLVWTNRSIAKLSNGGSLTLSGSCDATLKVWDSSCKDASQVNIQNRCYIRVRCL